MIGLDLAVAGAFDALARLHPVTRHQVWTRAVVNVDWVIGPRVRYAKGRVSGESIDLPRAPRAGYRIRSVA